MSPVSLEFQLDRNDLLEAARLVRRPGRDIARTLPFVGAVTASLGLAFFGIHPEANLWPALCLLAAGLYVAILPTWAAHTHHQRQLLEADRRLQPTTVTISDHLLRYEDHAIVVEYRWHAFTHVRETSSMFALLQSPDHVLVIIPKRALPSDITPENIRQRLQTLVVPPTARFPVLPTR